MRKLLIVSLISVIPMISNAWTRTQVITEIRSLMSDTNTDTSIQVFSDNALHARIDQAEEDINKQIRYIVNRSTIATTCGTREYSYPATASMIYRVAYDTDGSSTTRKYVELTYMTIDQLDRDYSSWDNDTSSGTPSMYYYWADKICFYPTPGLKYSGDYGDAKLYYIITPTTSTTGSTEIYNGYKHLQQFKNCIIDYVCAMCATDQGDANMINFWWNKYTADMNNTIERIQNKPDRIGGVKR